MKSIALSVCPKAINAGGTQQTLGNVCNPSASVPIVSRRRVQRAVRSPSGKPPATPIK